MSEWTFRCRELVLLMVALFAAVPHLTAQWSVVSGSLAYGGNAGIQYAGRFPDVSYTYWGAPPTYVAYVFKNPDGTEKGWSVPLGGTPGTPVPSGANGKWDQYGTYTVEFWYLQNPAYSVFDRKTLVSSYQFTIQPPTYTLTTGTTGTGRGTVTGAGTYARGATAKPQATPTTNLDILKRWVVTTTDPSTGLRSTTEVSRDANPLIVTITSNTEVIAEFEYKQASVSFSLQGTNQTYAARPLGVGVAPTDFNATYDVTYTGNGSTFGPYRCMGPSTPAGPINVGTYQVSIIPTGDYTSTTPNPVGTFTITPKPVTFSFDNTENDYTGGTFTATVSASDPATTFTPPTTTYGPGVGQTTVSAEAYGNYSGAGQRTAKVNPAKVSFTFGDTSQIYTGGSFDAKVTPSIPVATYTAAIRFGPSVGEYTISAVAYGNYTGNTQATASVRPAEVSFDFGDTDQTYTGGVLSASVSPNPSNATYTASLTGGPDVGSYAISASGTGNYAGAGSSTLTISKATPTVSWANPAPITYGTGLSSTQLNATASVPGSFSYSPAAGAVLGIGPKALSVTFTPSNSGNYNSVSRSVALTVQPKPVTFAFGALTATYDGTAKTATVSPSDPAATFTSDVTKGPNAGSYAVSATATGNYSGTSSATLVISPAPQTVTLSPSTLTLTAGQSATFTATGGHNAYQWAGNAGAVGSGNSAVATFATPGTYTVTVTNAASGNYLASNTATASILVGVSAQVVSFTPLESSYTVTDPASPMNGQTYPRQWKSGGWVAYLGRPGVKFELQAQASPSVKTIEVQSRPPGGAWSQLATQTPSPAQSTVDTTFSVQLGESAPGQPLVPLSYFNGSPQTGTWTFRARVQDSNGNWSSFSPEVPVDVVLPISSKAISGRTVPPAGPLGDWFTASPVQTYTLQFWVP